MARCSTAKAGALLGFAVGAVMCLSLWKQHSLLRARELQTPGVIPARRQVVDNPGKWDWTPAWSGQVVDDRRGLASDVWRDLASGIVPPAAGQSPSDSATGRAFGIPAVDAARRLLRAAAVRNETLGVIQVGACDGAWEETNDPVQELLKDPGVKAVALEPVPYLWKELDRRLRTLPDAEHRLLAVNAAMCLEAREDAPFYVVSPRFAEEHPDAKHWAKRELGSFRKSHLHKHSIPDQYIDVIKVPCLAPAGVLSLPASPVGAGAAAVDALVVDAEGLDAELVLAMFDIADFRPALLIFEQKHVPRPRLAEALRRLRALRYVHWKDKDQLVAVLAAPDAAPRPPERTAAA